MASRSKNKKSVKKKISKELANQIRHLEVDLSFTLRAIDGKSEELDDLFTKQANRIKIQLDKAKRNR